MKKLFKEYYDRFPKNNFKPKDFRIMFKTLQGGKDLEIE
jgi:hypothetical protein